MKFSWPSLSSRIVKNTAALYAVQFAEYLLPMLTVPYLSRRLGSDSWGLIIYAQSFAGWLGILLEYGFSMSATRRLSRLAPEDSEGRARIVAGVMGASILLMTVVFLIAAVCAFTVPIFAADRRLLLLGVLIALVQGLRPFWYFQGIERLAPLSALNLAGRCFTTAGVFLFVFSPQDGWWVLMLQLLTGSGILILSIVWICRDVPWQAPTLALAKETLIEGWGLFVMRSSISLYTLANTFILGLFANPQQVAFYGGSERLNKAALGVMQPLISVLYPRMNHLLAHDLVRARQVIRQSLAIIGGLGGAIGLIMALTAPIMIRILGRGYEPAIPVFRVMSLLAPLIAVNSVLGAQWLIPLGHDRPVNRVIMIAGVLNVSTACWAAPRFGPLGMAWCVVGAEGFILAGLIWLIRSLDKDFLSART